MTRRKPSGWQYSGVVKKSKRAAGAGKRQPRRGQRNLLRLFGAGRAKRRRGPPILMPRSRSGQLPGGLRSIDKTAKPYLVRLTGWVLNRVANRKWRPLSMSERLIWVAVAAVSVAFLMLMAKSALLMAAGVFFLLVAFAWRELGER